MRAAVRGAGLWRRLASHLALPLRRGDGYGTVVVVVAACLFADEVLDLSAVLRLPVECRRLERDATVGHYVLRPGEQTIYYAITVFQIITYTKSIQNYSSILHRI